MPIVAGERWWRVRLLIERPWLRRADDGPLCGSRGRADAGACNGA